MTKKLIITAMLFLLSSLVFSQTGALKGKVTDKNTHDPIPFANLIVEDSLGNKISGAVTDIDGLYAVKTLSSGIYNIRITYVGYTKSLVKGVIINANKVRFLDLTLKSSTTQLDAVEITAFRVPLIDKDCTSSGGTMTTQEISKMPGRSAYSNATTVTVGGVFRTSSGDMGRVRGTRSSNTATYIDGVKVIGSSILPASKIASMSHTETYDRVVEEVNTESYDPIVENQFNNVYNEPLSTFSIDVDKASYSNVRRFLNNNQMPPPDAVRIEELINYFHYDYASPEGNDPFSINFEAAVCPWNSEHQIVQIGLKGKEMDVEDIRPSNLVFLLDVSGSMSNHNKLPLLKKSMKILIEKLRPEDRVAIVVYAGAAGCVLKSTSGANKEKIYAAIDRLSSGGSTAGGAGIKLAYDIAKKNLIKKGNNRVILATDGDFNVGVSDNTSLVKMIESKRDDGVFLTVLGFGMGNYKEAKMEQLSNAGNGNFAYIDNILEAEKMFGTELWGTLYTIAKDVKIQIEFNPALVQSYRLIGYENRMLAAEDFNDDTKDAGEIGLGHYVTAIYEVIPGSSKKEIEKIDTLKYQSNVIINSDELLTVKFRYKEPNGTNSKLISKSLRSEDITKTIVSNNLMFSSSVAEFGLLLRNSEFKADATYSAAIKRAKKSEGDDPNGYRAEFIKMIKTARLLASQ